MKKLIIFIILNCALLIGNSCCQSITWQRVYGKEQSRETCFDICRADGNNFYTAGDAYLSDSNIFRPYLLKVNDYGDTLWSRYANIGEVAFTVCPSTDGGCVITGESDYPYAPYAVKFSSNGEIIWQKSYIGSQVQCFDIIQTSDGGYLLCGTNLNNNWDGFALKIDSQGNQQWSMIYPAMFFKDLYSVQEAIDGGYIFAGIINDGKVSEITKAYIMKTDISGNPQWEKRYMIDSLQTSAKSILKFTNGYLISGTCGPGQNKRVSFFRIDINGNLLFSKKLELESNWGEWFNSAGIINPNRYVFCFDRDSIPDYNAGAVITDSVGNVIQTKILNYPGAFTYASPRSIMHYQNGDIVFGGMCKPNPSTGFLDVYLVRTDSNLNSPPIAISNSEVLVPIAFEIFPPYPNPFNSETHIKYHLHKGGLLSIKVYDVLGAEIESLQNDIFNSGSYILKWNAWKYSSGVYLIKFLFEKNIYTQKLIFVK
jgi:hypothetical protein